MKNIQKGFTLVELLIVIALIAIILLTMSSLDFNSLSNRQKAEIFANKIISQIEAARNNSLMGKMVVDSSGNEIFPRWWTIGILSKHYENKENTVEVRYFRENQDFQIINNDTANKSLIGFNDLAKYSSFQDPDINKTITINCENADSKNYWNIHLTMDGKDFFKDPSCKGQYIIIDASYKNHTYKIKIDTITGIVTSEYQK